MSNLNAPLAGMIDLSGLEVRTKRFVTSILEQVAQRHGYEPLEIPLIERATSFAEEIIGRSPWPEWDQRGCFYLSIPDYKASYDQMPEPTEALLVPEGTISVTRWLGRMLSEAQSVVFPLKISYTTPCFRNELVDQLDALKRRQFTQFGLEVLGAPPGVGDLEAIHLLATSLNELGIPQEAVRVRLGDVAMFNRLVTLSGLSAEPAIAVKEALDAIAECKAGKKPHRRPSLLSRIRAVLDDERIATRWAQVWLGVAESGDPVGVLADLHDAHLHARVAQLADLTEALGQMGVRAVIDPCVVRSHEYYTDIAFEVDVVRGGHAFVEVGGGGRYDRLVEHFVAHGDVESVPATGWAFGVERLIDVLERVGALPEGRQATTSIQLGAASVDLLLVPQPTPAG